VRRRSRLINNNMLGFILIIIGIIVVLQTTGVIVGVPAGLVFGIALIVIGIVAVTRRSIWRERHAQWMAKKQQDKNGQSKAQ
jgi:membrane-bound ClpP family serine protease